MGKSSSSTDSDSSSEDSDDESPKKKKKKKTKKKKKKEEKKKVEDLSMSQLEEAVKKRNKDMAEERRRRAPMTKEWDKQQSVIRREYDEDTGRVRLVKGSGEILEEIVSRDRQKEINRQATLADGNSFQTGIKSRLGVKARLY